MKTFRRTALLFGALTVLLAVKPLSAQALSVRAGAGSAIPVGGAKKVRDAGPAAAIAVELGLSRRWRVRLDGEWSLLNGPAAPPGQEIYSRYSDLRTQGGSLNAVMRFSDGAFSPYLLAGIGAYRLQRVRAPKSPYGTTPALQAGVGVDVNLSRSIGAFAEARGQVHTTDYGAAREFGWTTFWPLIAGIRIQ